MKGERDARARENAEALKSVEELKQQVSAKGAELEKERKEKAAGAERLEALERATEEGGARCASERERGSAAGG